MDAVGVATYLDYRDYLEVRPAEYAQLFDALLIHVTSFVRDPAAWQVLHDTVLPELLRPKGRHAPIRVWTAGCSTGEEAYTLAIILAEPGSTTSVDAVNRRGKHLRLTVSAALLHDPDAEASGALLVLDPLDQESDRPGKA